MGGIGLGTSKAGDGSTGHVFREKLEGEGIPYRAPHRDRVPAAVDQNGIPVLKLNLWDLAVHQKAVEVRGSDELSAAQDTYLPKAPTCKVNPAGAVEKEKHRVGGYTRIATGGVDISGHVDDDRRGAIEVGVDVDIASEDTGDGAFDVAREIGVADAFHVNGAHVGYEDVSLGIDHSDAVKGHGTPDSDSDLIARLHDVFGVEPVLPFGPEAAGEQVGAERWGFPGGFGFHGCGRSTLGGFFDAFGGEGLSTG